MPRVIGLYTASDKGLPMEPKGSVYAIAGHGLRGDRYATDRGTFSHSRVAKIRHVSLITMEAFYLVSVPITQILTPIEVRRNIVTEGLSPDELFALIGRAFCISGVWFRGTSDCNPCSRPDDLACKQTNFAKWPPAWAGIRAEIVSDGYLGLGDEILIAGADSTV